MRGGGAVASRPAVDAPDRNHEVATTERTRRALALWSGSMPALGTPADRYLSGRGLPGLVASPVLRFRVDTPHPACGRLSALIALIRGPDGAPVAIHRTFLRRDGSGKAAVEPVKATLGPVSGGAIRLDEAGPEIVVGEGLESSASAGRMLRLPAWAAISAGNLARSLALPVEVRSVIIAVDRDPPGERAAHEAARRWQREGRRVQLARPKRADADFNDLIREPADA